MNDPLFAIVGPTATGKSRIALEIAETIGGEIVTVDSAQVFAGLDIGTAKPTAEEQRRVRHHLIDVIPPDTQWSAAHFARAADRAIADARSRGRVPLLVGGTGLWMRALVRGIFRAPDIDPEIREEVRGALAVHGSAALHRELARVDPTAASRIQPGDPQRIGRALEVFRQTGTPISTLQARHGFREARYTLFGVALDVPRETLWARIEKRTRLMYSGGILEEAERALDHGLTPDAPGLRTIGYRDAVEVVQATMSRGAAEARTILDTRRYAKRQRNWFNHEPDVRWLPAGSSAEAVYAALRFGAARLPAVPGGG